MLSRDEVAGRIEDEILRGDFPVGQRLPGKRDLATRFQVSRPVVREALRGLAARGLIEIAPGRGAFPRPVQAGDARMMLEREAAVLAARRATSEELEAMERVLARFDSASNLIDKARWDVSFHALLAKMAHNGVIETMFHSIVSLTFELVLRSLGDPTVSRAGVPYHAQILAALRAGDAERARQAVEDHLLVAGRLYGSDLDQNLDLMARRELERFVGPSVSLESILDTVVAEVARASERGESDVEEDDQ